MLCSTFPELPTFRAERPPAPVSLRQTCVLCPVWQRFRYDMTILSMSDSTPVHLPAEPRAKPRRARGQDEEEGGQEVQQPLGPAQLRPADH